VGFVICPHICGCNISEAASNKSRRKPKWLQRTPVFLKAGSHLKSHAKNQEVHSNCNRACRGFEEPGRTLTDQEYTAWVPHLGNWTQLHPHIPEIFQHLIPVHPLEDAYRGIPPNHPLPNPSVNVLQGMGRLSMQPQAASSSSRRPQNHPQHGGSLSTGPNQLKLLMVATPRVQGCVYDGITIEEIKQLVVYDRFIVTVDTPPSIKRALQTAPRGYVIPEPADDANSELKSYFIHDVVSVR
jgi:hypothetical protein